jgi:hypothetical protein
VRLITPSSLGLGLSIKTEMGKSMDSENIVQGEEKKIDTKRLHAKSKELKPIVIAITKRLPIRKQ